MSNYFSRSTIEKILPEYKIIKSLEQSGCAETFLAEMDKKKIVIKVFRKDFPTKRSDRERDMMKKIDHENVVKIINFDKRDDITFLTMEFIEGQDLNKKSMAGWTPTAEEIIKMLTGYSSGISSLSQKKISHRDIKPSNLMLSKDGTPMIIDLGIAKDYQRDTIITEVSKWHPGTLPFMSPEQIRGKPLDFRSDLFSLGISLFKVITGHHPFGKDNKDITDKILDPKIIAPRITKYRSDIPEVIADIFENILNKKQIKRYRKLKHLSKAIAIASEKLEDKYSPIKKGSYFLHLSNRFNFLDDILMQNKLDGLIISAGSLRPTSVEKIIKSYSDNIDNIIFDNEAYRTCPGEERSPSCTKQYNLYSFTNDSSGKKISNFTPEMWGKKSTLRKEYAKNVLYYQKNIGCTIFLPPYFYIESIGNGFSETTIKLFEESQEIALDEGMEINSWILGIFINGSEILEEVKREELLTMITAMNTDMVYLKIDAKLSFKDSMMSIEMLNAVEKIIEELENNEIQVLLSCVDWEGFGFLSRGLSILANGVSSGKRKISFNPPGFGVSKDNPPDRVDRFDLLSLMNSLKYPGELNQIIKKSNIWKYLKCDCKFCKQQPLLIGKGEVIDNNLKDAHSALMRITLSEKLKTLSSDGKKEFFSNEVLKAIANHQKLEDEGLVQLEGKSSSIHLKRWLDFISSQS